MNYVYDAWGNLTGETPTKCSAESLNETVYSNNQLHTISGADNAYDAAGNMTHDATLNLNYVFDPENRITGAPGYTYTYDADGNRVEKSNGSTGTLYWYMSLGIVGESDLSGNLQSEYVFFDGERVARKDLPSNAVSYYFSDHLKTASVITDSAGNIKEDEDYYPWGGELQFVNNDSNHYKFTGKERDSETRLDYFGARYYGNWLGRWMSPDWAAKPAAVPFAVLGDPQTLNLYQYVRDNPIGIADTDGHNWFTDKLKQVAVGAAKGVLATFTMRPPNYNRTTFDISHTPSDRRTQEEKSTAKIPDGLHPNGAAEKIGFALGAGATALPGARLVKGMLREAATAIVNEAAARETPQVGQTVYRVFGGKSGPLGSSWTPIDQETIPNYRDAAGLPNSNLATHIEIGTLESTEGITVRPALKLDGNKGGLTEYVIPDPKKQVDIQSVKPFGGNN